MVAHPFTEHEHLGIPVALTALLGALLVFTVALLWPNRPPPPHDRGERDVASWSGALSAPQVVTRVVAVVLLVVAIAAGRLGVDDELENLAPALVVGTAWPLLVLASICLGPLWRWCDPWDGLARALTRGDQGQPPGHVWPAAALALPWVWYLSAYPNPLDVRSVGTALMAYTAVTLSGCLAVGRVRWLASAEPLGIVLSWMALVPRARLADWRPPRGTEALLGVLAGGLLFGAVRRSGLWSRVDSASGSLAYATAGVLLSCALAAATLLAARRLAKDPGAQAAIARAAVPAVAGIIVATALARNRLFNSVQLLPGLLGDPFGQGWDVFGSPVDGLRPALLGTAGLLLAQLAVLVVAHLVGAVVSTRRLGHDATRVPAAAALSLLLAGSMVAVTSH